MEKTVKRICDKATSAWDSFKEKEMEALACYKSELGKVKNAASAYKDEQSYIRQHQEQLARDSRAQIAEAEKEFCDIIHNEVVPALRAELAGYLTAKPDKDFMDTMVYYNTFGIKVDEAEVRALSYDTEGNYMQLRTLAAVAQKSGISVKFPSVAEYGKVIERMERMAQPPLMYCPFEYLTEGVAVLPDTPLRRADGSVYGTSGRPTSTGLIVSTQGMENTMKAIAEAGDTWSAAIVPEIGAYTDERDEDGEVVSTAAQQRAEDKMKSAKQVQTDSGEAVDLARKLGNDLAQGQAQVVKGLSYYM